jgi:hypothetical protein
MSHFPSIRRGVKDVASTIDCWNYLLTEEMLNVVAEHSDKYIYRDKFTNRYEINALIDLSTLQE